jgi:HAD superfamily hydrolase (TIGR01549 family)
VSAAAAGPAADAASTGSIPVLPLPTPRLVLFDVDFTLLRPSELFEAPGYVELGRRFGFDLDASRWPLAERAAFNAVAERRARFGESHDDGLMMAIAEAVIGALGGVGAERIRTAALAQIDLWRQVENFDLYPDVLPCLKRLDDAGLAAGIVTNTDRDLLEAIEHFGLSRFVTAVSASHDVGVMKPDPRIYAHALTQAGVRAADAVMVGDSFHDDVLGARAAGLAGILLDRSGGSTKPAATIRSLAELPAALGL